MLKKTNNIDWFTYRKTHNTDWFTDILKGLEDYTTIEDCLYDTKHIGNDMFNDIINDMTIIFKE